MERLVRRLPALSARTQDVLIAGFVTLLQVQGTHSAILADPDPGAPFDVLGVAGNGLLVLSGLALLVRRRWPVPVFVATALISVVYFAAGYPDGPGWISLFVAIYTVTAHGDGRRSLVVVANGLALLTVVWIGTTDFDERERIGWLAFRIGATIMAAALGESVRSRRVIAADALRRAEEAERTRDEEARRRVDAERLRIAREVHDTVAHAIAIINVQAGVTAHVLDKRPERARETLLTIEQTSARALREMRSVLGVLRGDDDGSPGPSLGALDELLSVARRAGLDVTVAGSVPAETLPDAVDRAAYRIVQEAITNVIRHAGPARVTVGLELRDGELRIEVADDGGGLSAPAGPPVEPGRGLAGMRERCELLGGAFEAGPDGDGFRVRARLPLHRVEAAAR
ncbi:sensor histidine kinase [Jiangella rhizosphaerae]|uniref:histidine kinase n=1 Tax=Jiangella rhizosphaerae TaxID=2293569 RepID=A0A418KSA9_9ACTN|nr:sensor histidine kinase [Jiangella rhizosphaerae]RIQ26076.1 sensor histidine kinase [Jiangella rhizosphaerae]